MQLLLVLFSLVFVATILLPSVVLSSEVALFEELCIAEYTLKKDLDTTEHREVVYELDLEYQDVMARRIALGLKLNIFYCATDLWHNIELNDNNRRSVELMAKRPLSSETVSSGEQQAGDGRAINSESKDIEQVKLGPQVLEHTEKRMHYFNKLCELEYDSKRKADVSRSATFNQYWKIYTKSTNTRISLGYSLEIPYCPRDAWSGRKVPQKAGSSKPETDCMRAKRAQLMCTRFSKAVLEENYDIYPEAVYLMNNWCALEKLFRTQRNQSFNVPNCPDSKHIEKEAEDMASSWLFLVEAEEVATKAEKEKGTYMGQPLRVLNIVEEDDDHELSPKIKKKTKLFNFSWFSNKKKGE